MENVILNSEKQAIIKDVLVDLRNQLEMCKKSTQEFDDGDSRWREGIECGVETSIELLDVTLIKHLTKLA